MRTSQIKKQLHDYIDTAEDKKLKAIYTLLQNDLQEVSTLTLAQMEELDKRYENHLNGLGKNYSWDETISIAKAALEERKR